jgi:hypothetical protein
LASNFLIASNAVRQSRRPVVPGNGGSFGIESTPY